MTMKQIAKLAGVSDTTVARVMDGYPHVSEEVVTRVNEAIRESGFVPRRRRNVKLKSKTGYVGLLLMKWSLGYLQQPLMAQIITDLERVLSRNGFQLVLTQVPDTSNLPEMVTPGRLDGVFVMGQADPKIRPALKRLNAILMLGGPHYIGDDYWTDGIGSDYPAGGYIAADYLISRGHKRLAYLNPDRNHFGFKEIGWSFQATAQRHGIETLTLLNDYDSGGQGLWEPMQLGSLVDKQVGILLDVPKDQRPTGIHVPADDITVLVYQALEKRGVRPGQDIEIVSRRNQEVFLSRLSPRPATLDMNTNEMARRLVDKLIYRMENPDAPQGARILIPPRLVLPSEVGENGN